jgi:peptide/nickel transport system substrate-binding protein
MPWVTLPRRDRDGHMKLDGLISQMWGHGIPGDPATSWDGLLHGFIPGTAFGLYSTITDPETDTLLDEQRRTLDPVRRAALLQQIARIKHDKLLGVLSTYRPLVTFAWRTDKVSFTPWPWPGYYRSFQEIGIRQ